MARVGTFCAGDEPRALCIIRDMTNGQWQNSKVLLNLPVSTTAVQLMEEIGKKCHYHPDSFELVLQRMPDGESVIINDLKDQTLEEVGFRCMNNARNILIIGNRNGEPPQKVEVSEDTSLVKDHDIQMGSDFSLSASGDAESTHVPSTALSYSSGSSDFSYGCSYASAVMKQDTGFVGLVNQAMTCYLNSLLQTLYMTPEFRNALYRWEFDGTEEDGVKSIPFQLQKLFLQLQTSKRPAIGTTELTTSFGWDSSEAWQQHDVQELCRVMFDALEQKFKNTDQADLISTLYEGKLKDYVKCLECGFESARIDKFSDVPLVVRPFGSQQSYGSVEEALRAFVSPETLDGSNQYYCEHCSKKCDAHKGLKFINFPYLLTLQLKRFDFDPMTLHRIKLNDRVTFPEILNLNDFIKEESEELVNDDADTTDSGSALDEDNFFHSGTKTGSETMSDDAGELEDDEGIDLGPNGHSSVVGSQEVATNERNLRKAIEKGPYVYELFSIMVHSGSANGGHYYAYIKCFKDGQWYCFNDAQVTKITYDDIRKTYGGGPSRGYYSSAYSSSTNAYMLMYRQIEKNKNAECIGVEEFPEHIKALLQCMQEQEERDRQQREVERNTCKIKLFCHHPVQNRMVEMRLKVHKDCTLEETTATARSIMRLDAVVPLDCCRLVKYDEFHDSLECSFDDTEDQTIGELLGGVKSTYKFDLLLETKKPHEEFQVYKPGGTTVKLYVVDVEAEEISAPVTLRSHLSQTVEEFREQVAQALGLHSIANTRLVLERYYNDLRLLENSSKTLKMEGFYRSNKVFVEYTDADDVSRPFMESRFYKILDRYEHTICIHVALPRVDKDVLEKLGIPANSDQGLQSSREDPRYDDSSTGKKDVEAEGSTIQSLPKNRQVNRAIDENLQYDDNELCDSTSSGYHGGQGVHSDHSEDSSLTDSERTLVGDELSPRNNSPDLTGVDMDSDPDPSQKVGELLAGASGSLSTTGTKPESESLQNSSVSSSPRSEPCEDERNLSSPEENTGQSPKPSKKDQGDWGSKNDEEDQEEEETGIQPKDVGSWYFRAWPYTDPETCEKMLRVYIDKRISLGILKKKLESWVGVHSDYFKLYRVYSNNQEYECTRLTENLMSYSEDSKLTVKLGRALQKGEYRVKVYQLLVNDSEPAKFLIDWVFSRGMTVLQAKKEILPEIRENCGLDIPLNRCRLRKKCWKNPGTIYLDIERFETDIPLFANWEVFLEILTEAEKFTSKSQVATFTRWWHPSTYQLDPFVEVVLNVLSVEELRDKLSQISGIPQEFIEIAKGQGTFPCDVSLLSIHNDLDWHFQILSLNMWPLYMSDDGHVIFYRDSREELKKLSEEEKREISNRESARLNKFSKIGYSPRKERALKIYTDCSPSTSNISSSSKTVVPELD
ncbi:ubiquitin carboxyl-terminal hydrolase 47-like isoform X3 [Tachypleus tridentatus]|uniref:ubiquitin carboxyl-terminal hydrolase 47-like isoform X3 n=1 Tax=Tachypleus tridentatus TaxID=6853 RepID=UPI003FD60089